MPHSPTCLVGAWIHPKHATYGNFKTFQTNKFYWLLWKTTKIKFPTSSLVSPLLLLKSPHLSQVKRWKISCKGANQHGSIDRGSAPWLQPLQHQHRPLPGSSTAWQKFGSAHVNRHLTSTTSPTSTIYHLPYLFCVHAWEGDRRGERKPPLIMKTPAHSKLPDVQHWNPPVVA